MVFDSKKFGTGARMAACTLVAGFAAGSQRAMAQGGGSVSGAQMGQSILSNTESALSQLVGNIIGVLQILLGIAALVSLFVVIYNIFKQERDAAQKAIWWVVGLAAGWAAMTVVGNLIGNR